MNNKKKIELLKDIKNGDIGVAFVKIRDSIDNNELTNRYDIEMNGLKTPPSLWDLWHEKSIDTEIDDLLEHIEEDGHGEEYRKTLEEIKVRDDIKSQLADNIQHSSIMHELDDCIREEIRLIVREIIKGEK